MVCYFKIENGSVFEWMSNRSLAQNTRMNEAYVSFSFRSLISFAKESI